MKLEGWIAKIKRDPDGEEEKDYWWIASGGEIHSFIDKIETMVGRALLHHRLISIKPLTIPASDDGGA